MALERMGVNGKSEQMKDVIDPSPHTKTKVASTRNDPPLLYEDNKETKLAVGLAKLV